MQHKVKQAQGVVQSSAPVPPKPLTLPANFRKQSNNGKPLVWNIGQGRITVGSFSAPVTGGYPGGSLPLVDVIQVPLPGQKMPALSPNRRIEKSSYNLTPNTRAIDVGRVTSEHPMTREPGVKPGVYSAHGNILGTPTKGKPESRSLPYGLTAYTSGRTAVSDGCARLDPDDMQMLDKKTRTYIEAIEDNDPTTNGATEALLVLDETTYHLEQTNKNSEGLILTLNPRLHEKALKRDITGGNNHEKVSIPKTTEQSIYNELTEFAKTRGIPAVTDVSQIPPGSQKALVINTEAIKAALKYRTELNPTPTEITAAAKKLFDEPYNKRQGVADRLNIDKLRTWVITGKVAEIVTP